MAPPEAEHGKGCAQGEAAHRRGARRRQAHGQRQGDDVQQRRIEPDQKPEGNAMVLRMSGTRSLRQRLLARVKAWTRRRLRSPYAPTRRVWCRLEAVSRSDAQPGDRTAWRE